MTFDAWLKKGESLVSPGPPALLEDTSMSERTEPDNISYPSAVVVCYFYFSTMPHDHTFFPLLFNSSRNSKI